MTPLHEAYERENTYYLSFICETDIDWKQKDNTPVVPFGPRYPYCMKGSHVAAWWLNTHQKASKIS